MFKRSLVTLISLLIINQFVVGIVQAVGLTRIEQQINILNGEFSSTSTTDVPTDNSFGVIHYDSSKYTNPTVYFEVVIRCDSCSGGNSQVQASLYNSSGASVTTISTTSDSYTRIRSNSLALATGNYTIRFKRDATGGTAYIKNARLIITQNAGTLTSTATQIEVGARGNTTATTPTTISSPHYVFDPEKFSGTTTAYFQATLRTDANTTTGDYVFNSYDSGGQEWSSNPGFMANSVTTSYASTDVDGDVQLLTSNSSNSTDLGIITKVEIRAHAYQTDGSDGQVLLRPVFNGTTDGNNYGFTPAENSGNAGWSGYADITDDPSAPATWTWSDVDNLDLDVIFNQGASVSNTAFVSSVEIRVTYEDNSVLAYAQLYNRTNGAVVGNSTLSTSSNTYELLISNPLTTDWDSVNADEYQVRIYTNSPGNAVYLSNAKIVIEQVDLAGISKIEVVHPIVTTMQTQTNTVATETTYTTQFSPGSWAGYNYLDVNYEATMRTTLGETGYTALRNTTDSEIIDSPVTSELTSTSTTYERVRSEGLRDNQDWPSSSKDFRTIIWASDGGETTIVSSSLVITAQIIDPSLSFSISGIEANTLVNGTTLTATSTVTSIPFGHLDMFDPRYSGHQLTVVTNEAVTGYTVTAQLVSPLQGYYPANIIQGYVGNDASWSAPKLWTSPTGTTPNDHTGWIGANITDTDVSGWGGNTAGYFGPISTTPVEVMKSTRRNRNDTDYVIYAIEVNELQPADTYSANIIYNILPTY